MGQLGGGLDHQLLLDVLAVGFDRLDAQMERLRDLAGAPALPDQAKHRGVGARHLFRGCTRSDQALPQCQQQKTGQGLGRPPGPCRVWRAGAAPPPSRSAPVHPLSKNRFEPPAPWSGRSASRNAPEIRGTGVPLHGARGPHLGASSSLHGAAIHSAVGTACSTKWGASFPERSIRFAERTTCSRSKSPASLDTVEAMNSSTAS